MPARQLTDDDLVGKFNGDLADWKETLGDAQEADNVPEVLYTDFVNTYTALRDTVKVLFRRAATNLATDFPEIKASMTQVRKDLVWIESKRTKTREVEGENAAAENEDDKVDEEIEKVNDGFDLTDEKIESKKAT